MYSIKGLTRSGRFVRLLTIIVLIAMMWSKTAPEIASAQTGAVATITNLSTSVDGPNGTFTATVTQSGGNALPPYYELQEIVGNQTMWVSHSFTVKFLSDGVTISDCAEEPITGGTATCNTQLPSGTHAITAEFLGTPDGATYPAGTSINYAPSTSDPVDFAPDCTDQATVTTYSDALGDDGLPLPGSLRAVVADPELCVGATVSFANDYIISSIQPSMASFNYIMVNRAITIDGAGHNVTLTGSNGVIALIGSHADVPLVLKNVTVGDAGCPVYVTGNVVISDVTFTGNHCNEGGAIRNNGTLTVKDSTFSGNSATDESFQSGYGGGGAIINDVSAHLTVSGSTFANNTAVNGPGGAINNIEHDLTITNSTFTGNSAYSMGEAVSSLGGTLSVTNSTFIGNTFSGPSDSPDGWGGIYLSNSSGTIVNSLFSGNETNNCAILSYQLTGSNNLSDDASCDGPSDGTNETGFTQSNTLNLGTLSSNGGPTQTIPLLAGSSAINAANSAQCPATDQRGVARPQGTGCDIGAFELAAPEVTTQPASQTAVANTTVTFSAASSPAAEVKWQVLTTAEGAVWSDIDGATNTAIYVTANMSLNGNQYRAVFTGSIGSTASDPATLSVIATASCEVTDNGNDLTTYGTLNYWLGLKDVNDNYLCSTVTFSGDMTIYGPAVIQSDVTIDGEDNLITISGDLDNDGTGDYDLLLLMDWVSGAPTATVKNLTLEKGFDISDWIAPIRNPGTLTLDHVTVSDSFGFGSVWNYGTLNVIDSSFSASAWEGLPSNATSGIWNSGTLNITRSSFSGNPFWFLNAGLQSYSAGIVTVEDSTFSNITGYPTPTSCDNCEIQTAVIANQGTMTVSGSTFSGNNAGEDGLIFNGDTGTLSVTNSTFSGNSATAGDGVDPSVGNAAGAIRSAGNLTLVSNTFANNSATVGATIIDDAAAGNSIEMYNNILVKGVSGLNCSFGMGATLSAGSNLADDDSCGTDGFTQKTTTQMILGTLGDNGGETQTIPLLEGSSAIDAGDDSQCPTTDQRGVARQDGNDDGTATCDIGSFEYEVPEPVETAPAISTQPADQSVTVGATASFNAAASGNPTPTVQWQVSTDTGVTWTEIAGASIGTLTITSASSTQNGYQYRAVFTNIQGSATTDAVTLTVSKKTATCNITGWSGTYDGQPHGASGTCTGSDGTELMGLNLGSTFTSVPGSNAHWTFSGGSDYIDQSGDVAIVIGKVSATVTLSSLEQTYTGSAIHVTATTNPSGLNVSFTYDDSSTAPIAVGSYTVVATINDTNYQGSTTGSLNIGKAAATVTLSNLSQTYDGNPKSVTVTTVPAGLSVEVTYNGSSIVPSAVDNYAVVAAVNNSNYQGTASGTLTISNPSSEPYTSLGFTAPVDLGGVLNSAKAGQMIPLKWWLLDGNGDPVTDLDPASVTLTVSAYACQAGVPTDAIETYTTGATTLQNLGDGYYQLNWKTDKGYANQCKQITLTIGDWSGDGFTALFQFKK